MDWVIIAASGVLGGLVGFAVAYALSQRERHDEPVQDVDALAVEVERIGKIVRRISMRNLRQDALDAETHLPAPQPPQLVAPVNPKDELRRKVFGGQRT
jgi:hypothetical protein